MAKTLDGVKQDCEPIDRDTGAASWLEETMRGNAKGNLSAEMGRQYKGNPEAPAAVTIPVEVVIGWSSGLGINEYLQVKRPFEVPVNRVNNMYFVCNLDDGTFVFVPNFVLASGQES